MTFIDYLSKTIKANPPMSITEERKVMNEYKRTLCTKLRDRLIYCNLRFAIREANKYVGYGHSIEDLTQEAILGMMRALDKFDIAKKCRLTTYSVWWIKAYLHRYSTANYSMIKYGTSNFQRYSFYKVKHELQKAASDGFSFEDTVTLLAKKYKVKESEVRISVLRLINRDLSLDAPLAVGSEESHIDVLQDDSVDIENDLASKEEKERIRYAVIEAAQSPRDSYIAEVRLLHPEPKTLDFIGKKFNISRERVRQIEGALLKRTAESAVFI